MRYLVKKKNNNGLYYLYLIEMSYDPEKKRIGRKSYKVLATLPSLKKITPMSMLNLFRSMEIREHAIKSKRSRL